MSIPDEFDVLLLPRGARRMFAVLPANFLTFDGTAMYCMTGSFSSYAAAEARVFGKVDECGGESAPPFSVANCRKAHKDGMDYVHITSSNTDRGTQYPTFPQVQSGVPLFVDASSDFLTRAVEWDKVSLLYATSHKNLGTAGVCVVVMRRDLRPCARHLPSFASLDAWRAAGSMLNTPVSAAVHVLRLMLQWCLDMGGLAALEERSRIRADRVYAALDARAATFTGLARPDSRSRVSITFRLGNEAQEEAFTAHARSLGIHGLAGYRLCGHLRACLFNAVPDAGVDALVTAIETFGTK